MAEVDGRHQHAGGNLERAERRGRCAEGAGRQGAGHGRIEEALIHRGAQLKVYCTASTRVGAMPVAITGVISMAAACVSCEV